MKIETFRKSVLFVVFLFLLMGLISETRKNESLIDYGSLPVNIISNNQLPESAALITENLSLPYLLDGNTSSSEYLPQAKFDSNNSLHVTWVSDIGGKFSVLYRVFYYLSQSWSPTINITAYNNPNGYPDHSPDLAINGTTAYLSWIRNGIGFKELWFCQIDALVISHYEQPFIPSSDIKFPQLEINVTGDILLVYYEDSNPKTIKGMIQASDSAWSWSSSFLIYDPFYYPQISSFSDLNTYLDNTNRLHIIFKASLGGGPIKIYYGSNTTQNFDQHESSWLDVTTPLSIGGTADFIRLVANPRNSMLYLTWSNVSSINLHNKTFDAENFNETACYKVTTGTNYAPFVGFDSFNRVIVTWQDGTTLRYVANITEPVLSVLKTNAEFPMMVVSPSDDIYFIYKDGVTFRPEYRILDRTGPGLTLTNPKNNDVLFGDIPLTISVAPDTYQVKYEYYNGTVWTTITTITFPMNFNYTWSLPNEDKYNIIIRVTAVDKNGLNQTAEATGIIIDNNSPEIATITAITDSEGRNGDLFPYFLRDDVIISYSVYDNTSGIVEVQLWNGSSLLTTNTTGLSGIPTQLIWKTDSSLDGNYSQIYIRAIDKGGKDKNSTVLSHPIIIDNTPPLISILTLQPNVEYSGVLNITVNASVDTAKIVAVFFDPTPMVNDFLYLNYLQQGLMVRIGTTTNWSILWKTNDFQDEAELHRVLNGPVTIFFEATDIYNNTDIYNISITLDNTPPTVVITWPPTNEKVGFDLPVIGYSDNDTVSMAIRYGICDNCNANTLTTLVVTNITNNGTHFLFNETLNLFPFRQNIGEVDIRINIIAIDNQGLIGIVDRYVKLQSAIPTAPSVVEKEGHELNSDGKSYNVQIKIRKGTGDEIRYLIYRSLRPFDTSVLNKMDPLDRYSFLGQVPGDKYCIGEIYRNSSESLDSFVHFTDDKVPSNKYFYVVLAMNVYNNPSNCSPLLVIELPFVEPNNNLNLSDLNLMLYIAPAVMGLVALFSYVKVKSTKKVRTLSEIKRSYKNLMDQEYNVNKKGKDKKTLGDRLDEMEATLEEQISGEKVSVKKRETTEEMDIDELLNMTVETEKVETIVGDGGLKKCPYCGWSISKGATKCPRCQKVFY
jgi:hypothetical protein